MGAALFGRDDEHALLTEMLSASDDGGGALILRGEAGVGKSRLLAAAAEVAAARGHTVLHAVGVQSQTTLAYTGLHQVLHPLLSGVVELPQRQGRALLTLFGLADGPVPDPLLIRLGALSLLEEAAQRTPVLLAVDDLHWLDQPTADVLGFVAHRLTNAPIVLLGTLRSDEPDPLQAFALPQHELSGLPDEAAAALLDATAAGLGPEVRAQVLEAAVGNPLALLELPRSLSSGTAVVDMPGRWRVPLTMRLERIFGARLRDLPSRCRDLLVLVAAEDGGPVELWRAAEPLGLTIEDLIPAEQAGVVTVHGSLVRFRHPMVRSAVYSASSLAARTRAHLALADAMSHNPDRAVWHRAAATLGHDEGVSAELEASGDRHRGRGAMSAAMAAYERAARLSLSPERAARLLGLAAEAGRQAGDRATGARLIAEAMDLTTDPRVIADLVLPEYHLGISTDTVGRRADALIDLARKIDGAPQQALVLAVAAMDAYNFADRTDKRLRVEEAVLALAVTPEDPARVLALAVVAPERHAAELSPIVRRAAEQMRGHSPNHLLMGFGGAAETLRMLPTSMGFYEAAMENARRDGSLADYCMMQVRHSSLRVAAGDLAGALSGAEQAYRLAVDLSMQTAAAGAATVSARVHAWRGDEPAVAASLALTARHASSAHLHPLTVAERSWAAGLLALAQDRPVEAAEALLGALEHRALAGFMIGDLAEAAWRLGGSLDISAAVRQAESEARMFDSDLLRHVVLRARALSGDGEMFRSALAAPGEEDHPLEWARTRLAYGEWLRRGRRAQPARTELAAAAGVFARTGATPWENRAVAELRAAGGVPDQSGAAETREALALRTLTPQELHITRLAATGLSNREIADQLFLSPRTVGAHLYRIFPKLGVRSRAELPRVLASGT